MKISKTRVLYVAIIAALLLVIGIFSQHLMNKSLLKHVTILDSEWMIQIGDKVYDNQTLSLFHMPELNVGDEVTLTRQLEKEDYTQAILQLYSRYSAIKIFVDGELLYQDGQKSYEAGAVLGNGYHWVAMPEDYAGSQLKIVYQIGEKNAFTSVDPISLVKSTYMSYQLITQSAVTGVIACTLFVIGFFGVIYVALLSKGDSRFAMLLWLGLFSMFISLWMIASSRLIELVYVNLQVICYMEYINMYLACTSMLFFVAVFFRKTQTKKKVWIMGAVFTLLTLVVTILNVTNIRHFPKTVMLFHITALIFTIIIVVSLCREYTQHKSAERAFLFGIVCFSICVVLELIRYRYNKICIPSDKLNQSMIPIGAIIFTVAMFGSFLLRILERVAEELERKKLYDMAYQDAMTGIRNRAWCEKVMNDFETNSKPITLINMDLNLFKQVNDTFGHAVGDELLIRFADILSNVFADAICVGRMGGDEFVVIDDYKTDEEVDAKIEQLFAAVMRANKQAGYSYKISVSYGHASGAQGEVSSPWKVYEQADARMYQYKKQSRKADR